MLEHSHSVRTERRLRHKNRPFGTENVVRGLQYAFAFIVSPAQALYSEHYES